MRKEKAALLALVLGGSLIPDAFAGANTGAAFLKIDPGARPAALGGAFTASADDIHALHYNPAGLARIGRRELGASHTQYLEGMKFDFVGFAQPLGRTSLGFGVSRLTGGAQDGRGADRQATGGFESSDTAYSIGLGRATNFGFGRTTNLGMNAKLLESKIGPYSARAIAFDFGMTQKLNDRFSMGLSVLNMGKSMRFLEQADPLPLTVSVGGACRVAGFMNLAVDVSREVHDQKTDIRFGTEYAVMPSLSLRAGYISALAQESRRSAAGPANLGGLGAGFGLKLGTYDLNYSFAPFGELGNIQRISLGMKF